MPTETPKQQAEMRRALRVAWSAVLAAHALANQTPPYRGYTEGLAVIMRALHDMEQTA